MNPAKIQLSQEELELVTNSEWLLTKNAIIRKTYELFGDLSHELRNYIEKENILFAPGVLQASPKISKGENYKGLPYVILDYPRCFGKDDVFAIRTMFWWGNFFSVTLHLKGIYLQQFLPVIKEHCSLLINDSFYISTGNNEWRHDFGEDNYKLIEHANTFSSENFLTEKIFCKISSKISLQEWNDSKQRLWQMYQILFQVLAY